MMNIERACFLLDIPPDELYDPCTGILDRDRIKRQYRTQSLRLHPDKNPAPDAAEQFQCMNEAYVYISNISSDSESETLWEWFQNGCVSLPGNLSKSTLYFDFSLEEHVVKWMDQQDKDTLLRMHELLSHPIITRNMDQKNKNKMLCILRSALDRIQSLLGASLKSKCSRDQTIVLRPTLADVLNDQVFRLVVQENTYWIPLWVEELVYDRVDHDLIVQCIPELPSNVVVDDNQHLYVSCEYSISHDIWGHNTLVVVIPSPQKEQLLRYPINVSKIRITHLPQKILLSTRGIPRAHPDKNNVYDVSRRGSIFAWVTLTP
jgi:hypothetical protein